MGIVGGYIWQRRMLLIVMLLQQETATHCNTLQHTATHCNTMQNVRRCLATGIIVAHLVITPSCLVQDSFWHICIYIHTHTRAHAHTRARTHTHTYWWHLVKFNFEIVSGARLVFNTHTHAHTCTHTAPIDDILCGASFVQDGYEKRSCLHCHTESI